VVGVIDGPADLTHPDLDPTRITTLTGAACRHPRGLACRHGTAVVGILAAGRDSPAPGICPGCTVLLRPIFHEPAPTPNDLATAIVDVVAAAVDIINLSLGLDGHPLATSPAVDEAFDHARANNVLVVVAAGNHGHIGPAPLLSHRWPIPVVSCDDNGNPLPDTNLGITIGQTGLRAPGHNVNTLAPNHAYQRLTGTSAAAPIVAGTAALLWSVVPDASAADIRSALLLPDVPRRSIVPPMLDAEASLRALVETV
jgi:subtilisin family serine protease